MIIGSLAGASGGRRSNETLVKGVWKPTLVGMFILMLISKGADVNAKTSLGQTPLQLAQKRRNTETIELLRKYASRQTD